MPQPDLVALTGGRGAEALDEARRTLQICNACRYCEGYCAVFPAMVRRREFLDQDVVHLANLCHGCRDCFHACQYAPPHEFGINVPQALAAVRLESYRASAPAPGFLFARPLSSTLALLVIMTVLTEAVRQWFGGDPGGRGFYTVLGREAMITFGTVVAGLAAAGLVVGLVRYLRIVRISNPDGVSLNSWWQAARHAVTLRYLGGNGVGCNDTDETFAERRRLFHHLMAGGFVACFAATSSGAFYDHFLGWIAPYPLISLPGILGTIGGLGIVVGTSGLLWLKHVEIPTPTLARMNHLDCALLLLLSLAALTGLGLRAAHGSAALTPMVVFHLASVAALFISMPLGKFVHAGFRVIALSQDAQEQQGVNTPPNIAG